MDGKINIWEIVLMLTFSVKSSETIINEPKTYLISQTHFYVKKS